MSTKFAQLGTLVGQAIATEAAARSAAVADEATARNSAISTAVAEALTSAEATAQSYTDAKVAALVDGAPETLDTLKEIADELANNESALDAITDAVQNHTHPDATSSTAGFMSATDKEALADAQTDITDLQIAVASHTSSFTALGSYSDFTAEFETYDEDYPTTTIAASTEETDTTTDTTTTE